MGRIYITGYKEISTTGVHSATEYEIYSDVAMTNLIASGTENNNAFLLEIRFNVSVNGFPYFVTQNTRAKIRMVYNNGSKTDWFITKPSTSCPNENGTQFKVI